MSQGLSPGVVQVVSCHTLCRAVRCRGVAQLEKGARQVPAWGYLGLGVRVPPILPPDGLRLGSLLLFSRALDQMERVKGQVNEGDTILVDHSDGRTFFVKVESGK